MAVNALKPGYSFPARDVQRNFHGNQLVYLAWDKHLMFAAPFAYVLPPTTSFMELRERIMPEAFAAHPLFANIDWSQTRWLLNGQPFTPQLEAGLAEQGIGHKAILRFQTTDQGYRNANV